MSQLSFFGPAPSNKPPAGSSFSLFAQSSSNSLPTTPTGTMLFMGSASNCPLNSSQNQSPLHASTSVDGLQQGCHEDSLSAVGNQRFLVIESGHTAVVLKAFDTLRGEDVAVKRIVKTQVARQVVVRELSVLRSIDHPNIIKLYDFGLKSSLALTQTIPQVVETPHHFLLVLEFVSGGDLFAKICEEGPEDPSEVPYILLFRQIISALAYMHENGYCHRNIKLENVLLSPDGKTAKLCDFGFSCKATQNSVTTLPGTPEYMAPELVAGKHGLCLRATDVWSAGILLFAMQATNHGLDFPWEMATEKNPIFRAYQLGQTAPRPWSLFSPRLVGLLKMMLAVDPSKRCTAQQAVDYIDQHFAAELNLNARPSTHMVMEVEECAPMEVQEPQAEAHTCVAGA